MKKNPLNPLGKSRISLPLILAASFLFTACGGPSPSSPRRVAFNEEAEIQSIPPGIPDLKLEAAGDFIYCRKPRQAVSLRGAALGRTPSAQATLRLTVSPGLSGDYVMDFSTLARRAADRNDGNLVEVFQMRNGASVWSLPVKAGHGQLKRHRPVLHLQAGDTIEFKIRNRDIAAGVIGRPIFYPPIPDARQRRFVFILVADTLRADSLGVYDAQSQASPAVDAFARDAVVFDRAYSTSPWTLPAHVSLFTGLGAHVHGINYGSVTLAKDIPVLFETIQDKFLTHCFNADGYMSGLYGFCRGFDIYHESFSDHNSRTAARDLFARARNVVESERLDHSLLLLHTYQIHTPYIPEIRLAREYYAARAPGFDGLRFNPITYIENGRKLHRPETPEKTREFRRIYDAGVYTFDHHFGGFIQFLREQGVYDEATIVLLSDHGEEFADHGAWEHGHTLYNELIRIPLIVKFPKNRYSGRRIETPVGITDVLPTIMEIYGISGSASGKTPGISLIRSIENPRSVADRTLVAYLGSNALRSGVPEKIAIITPALKYIHHKPYTPKDLEFFTIRPPELKHEMFDQVTDLGETRNIRFRHRDLERKFLNLIKGFHLRKGSKGHLDQLQEHLKSLGYL